MITSLTTRYRVVFTLSLVLCVLLVSGVPVGANMTSHFGDSGGKYVRTYGVFQTKEAWDNYASSKRVDNEKLHVVRNGKKYAAVSDGWGFRLIPLPPEPEPEPERGRDRERDDDRGRTREPRRTESCNVEWGHWYVDVITHVIPKLQIDTLTNVTTGIPATGKLSVTTKYTERRDGEEICRVYLDGVYSHRYSNGIRTETREGERTDYNSIKVIDHTGDLTVLRINETSGDLVLQWSNRYDAYRVHVDVVTFDGSLRQNLPVQVYIWPNGQTTSAIKVQTYRSVTVD